MDKQLQQILQDVYYAGHSDIELENGAPDPSYLKDIRVLIDQAIIQALEAFTDRVVAHWEPMDDEDLTVEGATTDVFNELNSYQEDNDVK